MKILMIIRSFYPIIGGAEKQCLKLSKELVKHGEDVTVLTRKLRTTKKNDTFEGIKIKRLSSLDYFTSFLDSTPRIASQNFLINRIFSFVCWTVPKYYFILNLFIYLIFNIRHYDIIHVHEAHWIAAIVILPAKLFNRKVIVKESSSYDYMTLKMQNRFFFSLTKKADIFIAISKQIQIDLIKEGIEQKKIRYIPNGVELSKEIWNNINSKKVLFVGNLNQQPHKGIDILIKAWSIVIKKFPDYELLIIGGGNDSKINKLINELNLKNTVKFLGKKENINYYYLNSLIFILPSRSEGLSNALLEAMAVGMPCIVTNISGNKDIIYDKINGLMVEPNDPLELSNAILSIINKPELLKLYGMNAYKLIKEKYSIDSIANKYIDLYSKLVK